MNNPALNYRIIPPLQNRFYFLCKASARWVWTMSKCMPCPYTHHFGHQNTSVMVLIWWSTTTGLKLSSILHRHILCTSLYPDVYLSMKICMQRRAGRRKQTKLCLSVFSFPWSLVLHHQSLVCHSRFMLAPVWKTRRLRRRKFFVDTNLFGSFSFLINKK